MHWKTTIYGVLGAVATAITAMVDVVPPWSTILKLIAAAALALLGTQAADKKYVPVNGAPPKK